MKMIILAVNILYRLFLNYKKILILKILNIQFTFTIDIIKFINNN